MTYFYLKVQMKSLKDFKYGWIIPNVDLIHVLDFDAYFAPTSRSWMSKTFIDSESLGKSGLRIGKWFNIAA